MNVRYKEDEHCKNRTSQYFQVWYSVPHYFEEALVLLSKYVQVVNIVNLAFYIPSMHQDRMCFFGKFSFLNVIRTI